MVDEDCPNYNTANNKNVDKLIEILRFHGTIYAELRRLCLRIRLGEVFVYKRFGIGSATMKPRRKKLSTCSKIDKDAYKLIKHVNNHEK